MQRAHGLHHCALGGRLGQQIGQGRIGDRFAHDGQPAQYLPFQRCQTGELLIQHIPDVVENQCIGLQKGPDVAVKEIPHSLRGQIESQGVARIVLDKGGQVGCVTNYAPVGHHPLARIQRETGQGERAHGGSLLLQAEHLSGPFPAGEEQATGVHAFGQTAQELSIGFVAGAVIAAASVAVEDTFQVVQHQQCAPGAQIVQQVAQLLIQTGGQADHALIRKLVEPFLQNFGQRGCIEQRGPDDLLKAGICFGLVLGQCTYKGGGQRALTLAAYPKDTH